MSKRAINRGEECTLTWVNQRATDKGYVIGDTVSVLERNAWSGSHSDTDSVMYVVIKPGCESTRVCRSWLTLVKQKSAPKVSLDELLAVI